MLIEFSAENYKSIRDEARLSLVADQGKEHRDTNVCAPRLRSGVRSTPLVRSAAIYGANAAGKSNLLSALGAMEIMVLNSGRGLDSLPLIPFRFDPGCKDKPSTLEAIFVAEGVRYQYGFAATSSEVVREWLYAWPRGRVQLWYERDAEMEEEYRFGDRLLGDKMVWRRATRRDALFLSTAIGLNSEQLRPVFEWFSSRLHIGRSGGWAPTFSFQCCEDERKEDIIRFLRSADFAISGLSLVKEEFNLADLPDEMPTALREFLKSDLQGVEIPKLRLMHETAEGFNGELDLEEESDGTQKIFALAGPWVDALKHGYVVILDELHDSLHPSLVRFLVDCFHNTKMNGQCAQLVFSTHETAILNQEVFRRDQIWFCEREESQATTLFPLNEFRPRKGVDNLERGYLSGRFGALPFISSRLPWVDEDRE